MKDDNSQESQPSFIQKAKTLNRKTDEYWIKFVKWLWLFVIFYILYTIVF